MCYLASPRALPSQVNQDLQRGGLGAAGCSPECGIVCRKRAWGCLGDREGPTASGLGWGWHPGTAWQLQETRAGPVGSGDTAQGATARGPRALYSPTPPGEVPPGRAGSSGPARSPAGITQPRRASGGIASQPLISCNYSAVPQARTLDLNTEQRAGSESVGLRFSFPSALLFKNGFLSP